MKKFIIALSVLVLLFMALDAAHYRLGWYIDLMPEEPVTTFVKTDGKEIYLDCGEGWQPFEIRGVNMGSGIPGKWATEFAIDEETYRRWFGYMDADSVLQADSLKKIVQPMLEDRHVVAVGGLVRIANDVELEHGRVKKYRLPRNLLACMQVLEYDRSFLASRILFDQFNGSLIISGAFGLFRKDVVIAAGGYNVSTLGEDMELVVKLHEYCTVNRMDYCIRYATDAICWTQAPERLSDLKKQRRRWHLGLFQSMMKHRGILFNPQFGAVSFISYFYFLVYELLSPVIEIFGVATMVLAWFSGLINVRFMVLLFLIYVLFGVVLSLTAFFARMYTADLRVSFADMMKAVLLCFFEITCLRFVLTWVRATAFFGYRKSRLQWGSMKRKTINYN